MAMLTDAQDAMGHALWDELHGGDAYEVCERDDGLIDPIPVSAYFSEYPDWDASTQAALLHARGRVLDLGVGAGRYALHLQEQGCEVVGIDNSPLALEVCRLRGLKNVHGCAATEIGPALGRFDTFLMLGNNFGLAANRRRAPWMLRRLAALGPPDARVVAQTTDVYTTKDPGHLAYQARNRARGRMSGQIRLRIRYRVWATPFFDYLMVSLPELEEIVAETPWRIAEILEAEDRRGSYTAVLARRP